MARVVMLVANNWETDSRVIREATAVSQSGHEVHVICHKDASAYTEVTHNGVTYHCLPTPKPLSQLADLPKMFRLHLQVLSAGLSDPNYRLKAGGKIVTLALRIICCFPLGIVLVAVGLLARWLVIKPLRAAARAIKSAILYFGFDYLRVQHSYRKAMQPIWYLLNLAKLAAQHLRLFAMQLLDVDSIRYLNQFGVRAQPLARELRPALVHAHDLVTVSGGLAISKSLGAKLIYDAHELETHTNYWGLQARTKRWIEFYERVLTRRCTAVVTVCESIADWLRDNYDIARPIVVHNSPDIEKTAESAGPHETLRARIGLQKSVPLAVYVGSVTIDRGLALCVRALASAPELHFAFVGPRYIETEKEILRTAAELGVGNRVHLVDAVPSAQVTPFISDADCSVIAIQNVCLSYYFCFPNKLLESVLADIPVVAARLIELENFVHRYHTGVIADETDPKAIALAIQTVIANRKDFLPTAEARKEIVAEYGWSNQKRKLLVLYSDILLAA
ncbi:MAG: glycosyltransferase family 4 protein [Bacteroidota bacterium]|nr:glycosyltransferase family 4 protein [Bacteroidota bacterium]